MTVTSLGFSVAVGLMQHVDAFGVRNPMLMTQITLRNVERRGLPVPWPSLFARKASYPPGDRSAATDLCPNETVSNHRRPEVHYSEPLGVLDAIAQRKIPGSFLPGILLDSCQTFGIRSYAERECSS
jgi:hypothetical protein